MRNFIEWKIKKSLCTNAEIYFMENTLVGGIRHENDKVALPGQKIYKVVDNDESENTVVLTDQEGNRYKFDQDDLVKALAEDSGANGFQALQYPVGYLLATSSDSLSKLSIYDPRLKDPQFREKDISKILPKNKNSK